MQEQACAKQQEEWEHAESAQAPEALCNGLNLSDALAEGSDVTALQGENAEDAPLSLSTDTCADATGDPAADAVDVRHDAPTFDPEPYTVADIQLCHDIMSRMGREKSQHQASCMYSDHYLDRELLAPLILSTSNQTFAVNLSGCNLSGYNS
jgi:hypothetical protein